MIWRSNRRSPPLAASQNCYIVVCQRTVEDLVEKIDEEADPNAILLPETNSMLYVSDCEALALRFDREACRHATSLPRPQSHRAEETSPSRTEIAGVMGKQAFRGVLAFPFDSLAVPPSPWVRRFRWRFYMNFMERIRYRTYSIRL